MGMTTQWSVRGRAAERRDLVEALALSRQHVKAVADREREERERDRDARAVGRAVKRQAREAARGGHVLRCLPERVSGARDGGVRLRRFETLVGLTHPKRSYVAKDGYSNFHCRFRPRGLGSGRNYQRHEVVRTVRYILRDSAREIAGGGVVSSISVDSDEIASVFAALEELELVAGRDNAHVYTSVIVSLPHELDAREALLAAICAPLAEHGLPYAAVLHAPDPEGDQRNYHAHVIFSFRTVEHLGGGEYGIADYTRADLNTDVFIGEFRTRAADAMNAAMERAGLPRRFTPKSKIARSLPPGAPQQAKHSPGHKHDLRRREDIQLGQAERGWLDELQRAYRRLADAAKEFIVVAPDHRKERLAVAAMREAAIARRIRRAAAAVAWRHARLFGQDEQEPVRAPTILAEVSHLGRVPDLSSAPRRRDLDAVGPAGRGAFPAPTTASSTSSPVDAAAPEPTGNAPAPSSAPARDGPARDRLAPSADSGRAGAGQPAAPVRRSRPAAASEPASAQPGTTPVRSSTATAPNAGHGAARPAGGSATPDKPDRSSEATGLAYSVDRPRDAARLRTGATGDGVASDRKARVGPAEAERAATPTGDSSAMTAPSAQKASAQPGPPSSAADPGTGRDAHLLDAAKSRGVSHEKHEPVGKKVDAARGTDRVSGSAGVNAAFDGQADARTSGKAPGPPGDVRGQRVRKTNAVREAARAAALGRTPSPAAPAATRVGGETIRAALEKMPFLPLRRVADRSDGMSRVPVFELVPHAADPGDRDLAERAAKLATGVEFQALFAAKWEAMLAALRLNFMTKPRKKLSTGIFDAAMQTVPRLRGAVQAAGRSDRKLVALQHEIDGYWSGRDQALDLAQQRIVAAPGLGIMSTLERRALFDWSRQVIAAVRAGDAWLSEHEGDLTRAWIDEDTRELLERGDDVMHIDALATIATELAAYTRPPGPWTTSVAVSSDQGIQGQRTKAKSGFSR